MSSPSERAKLDVDIFPTPKRLAAIDFDEALAMFFVVLYHSSSYSVDILGDGTAFFRYALNGVLSTCVPMFFLVNGFLLFRKPLNLEKHIRKTLRLTAVTIFWGFLIPIVASAMLAEPLSASEYLSYGWHYKTGWNNQLWFMGALVCIYTVFPLLKIAYDSHWTIFLFSVAIASILSFGNTTLDETASLLKGLLTHEPQLVSFDFFGNFDVLRGLHGFSFAYFCIGGLAGRHWRKIQEPPPRRKYALDSLSWQQIQQHLHYGDDMRLWHKIQFGTQYGMGIIPYSCSLTHSHCSRLALATEAPIGPCTS